MQKQILPSRRLDVCASCGKRVKFVFYNSKLMSRDTRVVYLRCPFCAAHAVRLEEIMLEKK